MKQREPLDIYDTKPQNMINYLKYNGYHFNKKMCDFAISKMRKMNSSTGKLERVEIFDKNKIDELLSKYGITLNNNIMYDYIYVFHMAMSDFYHSSLPDEKSLVLFVKDYVDDEDQADGFRFNRWYADSVRNGVAIEFGEMI